MKTLGILLFLFSLSLCSYSQDKIEENKPLEVKKQGYFLVRGGLSFPMDEFAEEEKGAAATGINIGIQYTHNLNNAGLGLFASIDINYNGIQDDVQDDFEDDLSKELEAEVGRHVDIDITYPKFLNTSISAGLNYKSSNNNGIDLIGNIGLVANIIRTSDWIVEAENVTLTTEFETANNFGYKIGGGIIINKKIPIEINYFSLGEYTIKGEMDNSSNMKIKQEISILTLSVGLIF